MRDPLVVDDASTLDAVDLSDPVSGRSLCRTHYDFDDRFAVLGFGLPPVPRRLNRDQAFWERPAVLLPLVALLALLLAVAH